MQYYSQYSRVLYCEILLARVLLGALTRTNISGFNTLDTRSTPSILDFCAAGTACTRAYVLLTLPVPAVFKAKVLLILQVVRVFTPPVLSVLGIRKTLDTPSILGVSSIIGASVKIVMATLQEPQAWKLNGV